MQQSSIQAINYSSLNCYTWIFMEGHMGHWKIFWETDNQTYTVLDCMHFVGQISNTYLHTHIQENCTALLNRLCLKRGLYKTNYIEHVKIHYVYG